MNKKLTDAERWANWTPIPAPKPANRRTQNYIRNAIDGLTILAMTVALALFICWISYEILSLVNAVSVAEKWGGQ